MTSTILLGLHSLVVLFFTLRILVRDDLSPPARLAWFIVMGVLPGIGSVIYLMFGEIHVGLGSDRRIAQIRAEMQRIGGPVMGTSDALDGIDIEYRAPFRYTRSINSFPPLAGHRAELMPDAKTARARLIADIDGAEVEVNVLYYIWLTDKTGTDLAQALIRAARRGVTCRAMADGLGSRLMVRSPLWGEMGEAGVQTAVALPINRPFRTLLKRRLDLRNHRKITVIDGRITHCGSQNCADPEFRVKPRFAPWVDIMLRVEGPAAQQNRVLFASDWMIATGQVIEAQDGPPATAPGFVAQVMGDGPTHRKGSTPQLFAALMGVAQESLTISTPYFVPDGTVLDALHAAIRRGVKVTLIFPRRNDSWIVSAVSRSFYGRLLQSGAMIHEYKGGLLHAKTLTIDGKISLIGSSNLDLRSFDLNFENNLLIWDTEITTAIEDRQRDYIAGSVPVSAEEVAEWSYPRQIWNNAIATIGPIL